MSKKALVVDDNATIRSLSRRTLEDLSFVVTEAEDGRDGLEKAQVDRFHLVLCDINMPRMNGIELVNELRKLPGYARIPILMITTEKSAEVIAQGKSAGANGWLVKPFQREKLISLLKQLAS